MKRGGDARTIKAWNKGRIDRESDTNIVPELDLLQLCKPRNTETNVVKGKYERNHAAKRKDVANPRRTQCKRPIDAEAYLDPACSCSARRSGER